MLPDVAGLAADGVARPATHSRRTVIASGEVPVLSVQMTCAHPSVSTAGSRRTSAFRRAIAAVPSAKVMW